MGVGAGADIELLDSEVAIVAEVYAKLASYAPQMSFGDFGQAVEDEFGEAGFKAYVVWIFPDGMEVPHGSLEFTLSMAIVPLGVPVPQISIVDRISKTDFDHERMTWEVQHDILGIDGVEGSIGKSGLITPSKSTAFITPRK